MHFSGRLLTAILITALSVACAKKTETPVARKPVVPVRTARTFPTVAQIEELNAARRAVDTNAEALTKTARAKTFSRSTQNQFSLQSREMEGRFRELLDRTAVIYGAESRSLLAAATLLDPSLKERASSIVALVDRDFVEKLQDICNLKTKPFLRGDSHPLCNGEKFRALSAAAFCTGFLASPTQIVTAGHCVPSQAQLDRTYFVFGFTANEDQIVKTRFILTDVLGGGVLEARREDSGGDFAIIRIAEQKPPRKPLQLANVTPPAGTRVYTLGHPQGLPLIHAGDAEIRPWTDPTAFFRANLDAYGGNSGSPVFDATTGRVIGVIAEGETDFITKVASDGRACDATFYCPKSGCQGEKCTRTTVFLSRIRN
jgi:hypothetical protein